VSAGEEESTMVWRLVLGHVYELARYVSHASSEEDGC
jgi:hypothetical protein